jgi:hypothetical protein
VYSSNGTWAWGWKAWGRKRSRATRNRTHENLKKTSRIKHLFLGTHSVEKVPFYLAKNYKNRVFDTEIDIFSVFRGGF